MVYMEYFVFNWVLRMKRMYYRYFRKPEELPRFVNENKLAKEDILATFTKDNNVWLYYWK